MTSAKSTAARDIALGPAKAAAKPPPRGADLGAGSTCMLPIVPEPRGIAAQLETLLDQGFGADRHQKTVYRLREGVAPIANLRFAIFDGARLVGSLRFWPIVIGGRAPAILLGPLAVDPPRRGEGIGRALMRHGLDEAARLG